MGRRGEALAAAERVVAMREELAASNRAAYLPDLARSFWTAAYVRKVLGTDFAAALTYCERAISLYRELVEVESDAFGEDLAAVEAVHDKLSRGGDGPG